MQKSIGAAAVIALLGAISVAVAQTAPRDVIETPSQLGSTGRIAPATEPGTPLIISGTVLAPDGKTSLAGVVVYAYHTDNNGYYRRVGESGEAGANEPRLRGWVKTDANGRFEFATIKPAPYANREVPAHIHIHAWGAGYPRQWFELEFQGDPLLPKQHFTDNTADFLYIIPLKPDSRGLLHGSITLQMRQNSNFAEAR